jgi:hypothetical protein
MRKDLKLIGAAEERRAILRHIRRQIRLNSYLPAGDNFLIGMRDMVEWLLSRDKRYSKRKGGLGK